MDVTALRDRIQSTLDANADIRRQAELDLKYVCAYTFWLAGLMRLTSWGAHGPLYFLGRAAARFYQCAARYLTGGAEQCSSAVWYVVHLHSNWQLYQIATWGDNVANPASQLVST